MLTIKRVIIYRENPHLAVAGALTTYAKIKVKDQKLSDHPDL
jgi:hypothetical protein